MFEKIKWTNFMNYFEELVNITPLIQDVETV